MRPFRREDALKPEVVALFRDRLAPAAHAAFDAGIASLAAGDYRKAETSFKSAVGPDIDSTALLVYVGVIYAADDDDMVAVGAWQTALFGGGDIPQLYAWLSQAQLRRHSLPRSAGNPRGGEREVAVRSAIQPGRSRRVYATFGKGKEAVRYLEQYLDKSPGRCRSRARRRRMDVPDARGRPRRARQRRRSRRSPAPGPRVTAKGPGRRSSSSGWTSSNASRAKRRAAGCRFCVVRSSVQQNDSTAAL